MLIPLKDWAKIKGMTLSNARARARRGTIKAVKVGRDWWADPADPVEDYRQSPLWQQRHFTHGASKSKKRVTILPVKLD